MGRLERGDDGEGTCYVLDGRPVHPGASLELRLPGDQGAAATLRAVAERHVAADQHRRILEQAAADLAERWVRVRFETEGETPVLYLPLGGPWEAWRAPQGMREGQEVEVKCETCAGSGRRRPGEICERCRGKGEIKGIVLGDPNRPVACDEASGTSAECDGGRVAVDRVCSDCEGRGRRWTMIERPEVPTGILRGSTWNKDLSAMELRWPRGGHP